MNMDEYIYESLQGTLLHPHPAVDNLFEAGMPCEKWYADMLDAYPRICARLGDDEEDEDVEIIITALQRIQKEIAFQMFRYRTI